WWRSSPPTSGWPSTPSATGSRAGAPRSTRACRSRASSSPWSAWRRADSQAVEHGVDERGDESPTERVAGQVAREEGADERGDGNLEVGVCAQLAAPARGFEERLELAPARRHQALAV